jgi:protein involved in polysaccharide export with SLBB domain
MRTVLKLLLLSAAIVARAAEAPAPAKAPAAGTADAPAAAAAPAGAAATNAPASNPGSGTNGATAGKSKEYLSTTVVDPEARELKPRDGFRFSIEEDPPPLGGGNGSDTGVYVSDGGEAMFPVSRFGTPYIKLSVAGKKLADIRRELKERLDAEYYKNCTVHLDLVQVNRGSASVDQTARVTFYGEMKGVVAIGEGENLTISEAILRVGGSEYADLRKVRIHRLKKETGLEEIIIVDVDKILKKGDRKGDVQLQGGDRVEVKEKGLF